jgi:hypothetical protein
MMPLWQTMLVHTQNFSENENQDHADEEPRLLRGTADTSVTDNADCEAGRKTSKTDSKASTELDEAGKEGDLLLKVVGDEDADDQAVDGNDTRHDDGNDICGEDL